MNEWIQIQLTDDGVCVCLYTLRTTKYVHTHSLSQQLGVSPEKLLKKWEKANELLQQTNAAKDYASLPSDAAYDYEIPEEKSEKFNYRPSYVREPEADLSDSSVKETIR